MNLANCSLNCTLMYRAELALKNALAQGLPEIERAGASLHRHGGARGGNQPTRAGGGDAQDAAAADAEAPGGEASADEDASAPAAAGVRERFLQWMAVQVSALGISFRDGIRVGVRDVGRDTVRDRMRRWRRRAYCHCPLFTTPSTGGGGGGGPGCRGRRDRARYGGAGGGGGRARGAAADRAAGLRSYGHEW